MERPWLVEEEILVRLGGGEFPIKCGDEGKS